MYLFKRIICFCLCWVFVAAYRLALVVASRDYSLVVEPALLSAGL